MKAKQTDDPVDIGDLCSDLRLAEKNRRTIHIKRSPRIEIYKEYQRGNTYKYVLATHYPNIKPTFICFLVACYIFLGRQTF
jgi:hypothetical protein